MKSILTLMAATVALAFSLSASAASAKPKHSPQHDAAVKKCKEDYAAAVAAAKTLKGKAHKDAVAMAKEVEKQCLLNAPQP